MKTTEDKANLPESVQADLEPFVETVITTYESVHGVTILHHELEYKSVVESGRNFASGIWRLRLTTQKNEEERQSSVFIKVPQLSQSYSNFKELRLYERELYMYETVLPRVYQFWPHEIMTPISYATSQIGTLALENLEESGFRLSEKNSHLDLTRCKVVLQTMGRFHALSLKYFQTHGTEEFDKKMNFSSGLTSQGNSLLLLFEKIGKYLIPSLSEEHRKMWSAFRRGDGMETLYRAHNAQSVGGFQVVIHGDLHCGNILWKNDECKLIDFQLSRRGPPVLDLIFFLITSVECEVFAQHREDVFGYYVDVVNIVLEELDCTERYTLAELNDDFEKYRAYSIFVLTFFVPMLRSEANNYNFGSLANDESSKFNDLMQSVEYISFLKSWMDLI